MFDDGTVQTGGDNEPDAQSAGSGGSSTGLELLAFCEAWAAGIDPAGLTTEGTADLVGFVHRARDRLDGVLARLADRARALEADGTGPPAEEAMTGEGQARALTGRDLAAVSEVTAAFPELGGVVRTGLVSRDAAVAIVRLWRRLDEAERAEFVDRFDTDLARRAHVLPPDAFIALVQRRGRSVRRDDGQIAAEGDQADNRLERRRLPDGRHRIVLDLDPVSGETLLAAAESKAWATLIAHRDLDRRRQLDSGLRAEALLDLIRAGAADDRHGVPRSHALHVVVDSHTLQDRQRHDGTVCETDHGTPIPVGWLHRYACDVTANATHLGPSGRPFDHGRTRRSVTNHQKRALRAHYGGCAITGTPFEECEIHHLRFWEHGGPTDYDNLVPLSRRWHHLIHDRGWRLVATSDGGLDLHRPDGTHHRTIPPPTPLTRRHSAVA